MKQYKIYRYFALLLMFFLACTNSETINNSKVFVVSQHHPDSSRKDIEKIPIKNDSILHDFYPTGEVKAEGYFKGGDLVLLREYFINGDINSIVEFYQDTALFHIIYDEGGAVKFQKRGVSVSEFESDTIDINIGGLSIYKFPAIVEIVTSPEQNPVYKTAVKYTTSDTIFVVPQNITKGEYIFFLTFADISKEDKDVIYISRLLTVN